MRLQHFKECLEAVRGKNMGSSVLLFGRSDRQTCSSPLFSSLPKQNWGVFCYVQVPLTRRTTSRYLHDSQLSRILNFILQPFISCTVCWNHSCCLLVSGCLMATMNPTSTLCHPLPVCPKWLSLCLDSCCHRNKLAERISVSWNCNHATERQHRLSLNSICNDKRNHAIKVSDPKCCQRRPWEDMKALLWPVSKF